MKTSTILFFVVSCVIIINCTVFSQTGQIADPLPVPGWNNDIKGFSDTGMEGPFIREGYPEPENGLSGREFVVSPGHGINWNGEAWAWERPLLFEEREDHRTARICNRWLFPYFKNAGAVVYSCRDRDEQKHEIIVDANFTTSLVQLSGSWQVYDQEDAYRGKALSTPSINATSSTACISYYANIPQDGFYSVSIWYPPSPGACTYVEYIIKDGGANSHVFRINQEKNTARWNYLDAYYFKQGKNQEILSITNRSDQEDALIVADAVRLGSGKGTVDFGGGPSGQMRWEESSQAWTKYLGAPEGVWNWGFDDHDVFTRFAYTNWQTPEQLLLRIHTNAVDGATGTGSYARLWGRTTEENQKMMGIFDKMLDAVWEYWDPAWCIWYTESDVTPWPFPSLVLELGFHDTYDPDMIYLRDPDFRHIICRGIYEGVVDYLTDGSGTYLPEAPIAPFAKCIDEKTVRVGWRPPVIGTSPSRYLVKYGSCPYSLSNEIVVSADKTFVNIPISEPGEIVYFQIRAENDGGISFPTETLAANAATSGKKALIVNGFDRMDWNVQETDNTRNFVIQHITALTDAATSTGIPLIIDSCSNEAVEKGDISLGDYFMVDWILGEEGRKEDKTARRGYAKDQAFTIDEQGAIKEYLDKNGRIFISGSETAWDLGEKGTEQDNTFLRDQCHCGFESDNAGSSRVIALNPGLFSSLEFSFDNETGGLYPVELPDAIIPVHGAIADLVYRGTELCAGLEYLGDDHRVIFFGFPFEAVKEPKLRTEIMTRIIDGFSKPIQKIAGKCVIDHILDRLCLNKEEKARADRNWDNKIDVADVMLVMYPGPTPTPTPTPSPTPTRDILFFDDFSKNSSASYTDKSGTDTSIEWACDYTADNIHGGDPIPSAPHTTDDSHKALRMEVNYTAPGNRTSANVFTLEEFDGDFRVSVDVFFRVNGPPPEGGSGSTEYYRMGINHTGDRLINLTQNGGTDTPKGTDGYYFQATGDAQTTYDYWFLEGDPKAKDSTCGAWIDGTTDCGVNGNLWDTGMMFKAIYMYSNSNYPGCCGDKWTTVKMEYKSSEVKVFLDDSLVHTYTDIDDTWIGGKVGLGMEDTFTSVAPEGTSFVLFDNLTVERLYH